MQQDCLAEHFNNRTTILNQTLTFAGPAPVNVCDMFSDRLEMTCLQKLLVLSKSNKVLNYTQHEFAFLPATK